MTRIRTFLFTAVSGALIAAAAIFGGAPGVEGQEQIDKADAKKAGSAAVAKLTMRVRAVKLSPESAAVQIGWRRGGEGLGGEVIRGEFAGEDKKAEIAVGAWSAWLPVETVVGRVRGWEFATLTVAPAAAGAKAGKKAKAGNVRDLLVEFEFAESGKVFKSFAEPAPDGGTVGFAFPGGRLNAKGAGDPEFVAALSGLSAYAKARRERLEKAVPDAAAPKQFAVIGHIGGYGEGAGYGVRHNSREIVKEECRTLQLLGVNAMIGGKSLQLADAAGVGQDFRRLFWGGPGAGSPMGFLKKGKAAEEGCPFDPALPPHMVEAVQKAIAEHKASGAKETWAEWVDEIGVFAKDHIGTCERCKLAYREYLKTNGVSPADLGKADWAGVSPYPIWPKTDAEAAKAPDPAEKTKAKAKAKKAKAKREAAEPPESAGDGLNYYYTYRFMTHATAQVFPASAKTFHDAGIKMFAMQGPTPSWAGASLDWHEFYDLGANTAFVFETSNRDARVWQLESYLADIGRGICARHGMPFGCLVKPHRGAPLQRMLAVAARGATAIEWYTYGPDYSKGDSFSQRPDLLEAVARGGRFLVQAEPFLYGAKPMESQVAFCFLRSAEIWDRANNEGVTSLEDAKWVYIALRHAAIPVDILSERQLAEGIAGRYKALYVVGSHLRRDAAAKVVEWVKAGGALWTSAGGLRRDERNQPLAAAAELFGPAERTMETWGTTPRYGATSLAPFVETASPAGATFALFDPVAGKKVEFRAVVGREQAAGSADSVVSANFADGKPAVLERACGKGRVTWTAFHAGLTYSAGVRRVDFDMTANFAAPIRASIAQAVERAGVRAPVFAYDRPLIEPILLLKDAKQCVALMNWAYRAGAENGGAGRSFVTAEGVRINLDGAKPFKSVRSLRHGELGIVAGGGSVTVNLPSVEEIDLLVLE
jgi:hypothetical protein